MNLILKLAWRNIWRNKRRSALTMAAISFAVMAAVSMRGLQIGTYELNIDNSVSIYSGYIQIQHPEYYASPSLRHSFNPDKKLISYINTNPHIIAFSRRINADGLISSGENTFGAMLTGIQPDAELKVTTMLDKVNDGEIFIRPDTYDILVGYKLLQNLKVRIGDEIIILAQGLDGSMGNDRFRITGTIKTGAEEFDAYGVLVGIETLQEMLYMHNRVTALTIRLDDVNNLNIVSDELKPAAGLNSVLTWGNLMPELRDAIALDNISGILFLLILFLIVAFGIINTILMSVIERFNEFGVNLAIGMPHYKLVLVVFAETILITITALAIGNILGFAINYYIVLNPIQFSGDIANLYLEYGFLPEMRSSLQISMFIQTSVITLIISLLSAIYPCVKLYKLEPLKGIRYT